MNFSETLVTRVLNSKDTLPLRLLIGSMCSRPCVKLKLNKLLDKSYRTLSTESLVLDVSTSEQTNATFSLTLARTRHRFLLGKMRVSSKDLQIILQTIVLYPDLTRCI